jgi:hypothetical protein
MKEMAFSIAINVVLGILLLALLYRKRTADHVRLSGPSQAMDLFRSYYPDVVGAATVADDRRGALIDLQRGAGIGLLQRQGRRWNARVLAAGEVSSVQVTAGHAVEVRFPDFAWPRASIRIADPEVRALWVGRLDSLTPKGSRHPPDLRHA